MLSHRAMSSGVRGVPWRARYSGDAQVTTRTAAILRATSEESVRLPMRTATSNPSSTKFTVRSEYETSSPNCG